jgi:hypothetical protein
VSPSGKYPKYCSILIAAGYFLFFIIYFPVSELFDAIFARNYCACNNSRNFDFPITWTARWVSILRRIPMLPSLILVFLAPSGGMPPRLVIFGCTQLLMSVSPIAAVMLDNFGNCSLAPKRGFRHAGQAKSAFLFEVAGPTSPTTSEI